MRIHGLRKVKYHRSAIITMRSILPRTQLIRTALVSSEQSLPRHGPNSTAGQSTDSETSRHATGHSTRQSSRTVTSHHRPHHVVMFYLHASLSSPQRTRADPGSSAPLPRWHRSKLLSAARTAHSLRGRYACEHGKCHSEGGGREDASE